MEVEYGRTNYVDRFINLDQFTQLAKALGDIDPVFEAIAHAMLGTGLRVSGALQIPVGPCKLNKSWKRAAELKHAQQEFQDFYYVPKGGGSKKCIFCTETMSFIQNIYVKDYYTERRDKYKSRHGELPSNEILWLNENGKPLKYHDICQAFADASKAIGLKVTSHFLRHTYATFVVWNWFKANDIKPSLTFLNDVYFAVKDQLGHDSPRSTELYIRTILRVKADVWLPKLIPSLTSSVEKNMREDVRNQLNSVFSLIALQ